MTILWNIWVFIINILLVHITIIYSKYLPLPLAVHLFSSLMMFTGARAGPTCHSHDITVIENHNLTMQLIPKGRQNQVPPYFLLVQEAISHSDKHHNREEKTNFCFMLTLITSWPVYQHRYAESVIRDSLSDTFQAWWP